MVSDDQGSTAEEILESALVANIHRQDLEELDEARALQRLLAIHGNQTALAKRLHRSQGWVSQRLALLNLTPELQSRIGQEPIDLLRAIGNKPVEQQQDALEELKAERARKEAEKREQKLHKKQKTTRPDMEPAEVGSDGHYGVIEEGSEPERSAEAEAAEEEPSPPGADSVPEPRIDITPVDADAALPDQRALPKLPYDNGTFVAMHLIQKMSDTEFDKMLEILNRHQAQRATADH